MDEPRVGQVVDRRYRLKREIARGGVAIVFEADHLFTERAVALKMLSGKMATDQEARRRLLLEAKALTSARHPNVVAVLDAGVAEGDAPFLVMEMLEGRSLDGILTARGRAPINDAVYVVEQVCEALSFMHARGLLHRDIKPGNIFLARSDTGDEVVKLVDFGIAVLGDRHPSPEETKITQQGELLGTPEYMAPEQLMLSEGIDHRADIYATGVVVYECLAGSVPFPGNYAQVLLEVNNKPPPRLAESCPDVSPRLAAVIERALAKAPGDRFEDARMLAQALIDASELSPGKSALLGIGASQQPTRAPRTLLGMPQADAAARPQDAPPLGGASPVLPT